MSPKQESKAPRKFLFDDSLEPTPHNEFIKDDNDEYDVDYSHNQQLDYSHNQQLQNDIEPDDQGLIEDNQSKYKYELFGQNDEKMDQFISWVHDEQQVHEYAHCNEGDIDEQMYKSISWESDKQKAIHYAHNKESNKKKFRSYKNAKVNKRQQKQNFVHNARYCDWNTDSDPSNQIASISTASSSCSEEENSKVDENVALGKMYDLLEHPKKRSNDNGAALVITSDISVETEQKLASLSVQSIVESFGDIQGNETYFTADRCHGGEHQLGVGSSYATSMGLLPADLVDSVRGQLTHQTFASEDSSNWDVIHINHVDFPQDNRSSALLSTANSQRFGSESADCAAVQTLHQLAHSALNNLDALTKANLHPTAINIPLKHCTDVSFEQSIKDISDITKCSDDSTTRLQLSHTEPRRQQRPVPRTPPRSSDTPQHSTPEKNVLSIALETPKYQCPQLGSRPSPTGSDNTPTPHGLRYAAPPVGEHSSSTCSCFDDGSSTPRNQSSSRQRMRRSVGMRWPSVGTDCSGSNDDTNDRTPVVCRHGRMRTRRLMVTSNSSGTNVEESGEIWVW